MDSAVSFPLFYRCSLSIPYSHSLLLPNESEYPHPSFPDHRNLETSSRVHILRLRLLLLSSSSSAYLPPRRSSVFSNAIKNVVYRYSKLGLFSVVVEKMNSLLFMIGVTALFNVVRVFLS